MGEYIELRPPHRGPVAHIRVWCRDGCGHQDRFAISNWDECGVVAFLCAHCDHPQPIVDIERR